MRCELIAELATNHGGDLGLAEAMIRAAAGAGADWVKTQAYQVKHLNPSAPQYDWLKQSALGGDDHYRLRNVARDCGVQYLTTVFHPNDASRLLSGFALKVGHAECQALWVRAAKAQFRFITYPWTADWNNAKQTTSLVTIPLYPAPPEAFAALTVNNQTGYSDHSLGLDLCKIAIAQGAPVVEKHFSLPGQGRNQDWDMTPEMLQELRAWAETCAVALDGTRHQGRWQYKG